MERAQALEITPGFLETYPLADKVNDIDPGFDFVRVRHKHHDYTIIGSGNGVFRYVRYRPIVCP